MSSQTYTTFFINTNMSVVSELRAMDGQILGSCAAAYLTTLQLGFARPADVPPIVGKPVLCQACRIASTWRTIDASFERSLSANAHAAGFLNGDAVIA